VHTRHVSDYKLRINTDRSSQDFGDYLGSIDNGWSLISDKCRFSSQTTGIGYRWRRRINRLVGSTAETSMSLYDSRHLTREMRCSTQTALTFLNPASHWHLCSLESHHGDTTLWFSDLVPSIAFNCDTLVTMPKIEREIHSICYFVIGKPIVLNYCIFMA